MLKEFNVLLCRGHFGETQFLPQAVELLQEEVLTCWAG